jgi:four helix bundle protein
MGDRPYYTYSFEKLEVWKLAREMRNEIYLLSREFPSCEKYGVISQIRRAANSVTDNLAEGSGRASNSDRAYFTNIAYTSSLEVINQLITSHDQHYITTEIYEDLRVRMDHLINKLNAFYRHQLTKGTSVKKKFKDK